MDQPNQNVSSGMSDFSQALKLSLEQELELTKVKLELGRITPATINPKILDDLKESLISCMRHNMILTNCNRHLIKQEL